jgi:hypothetical protein
MPPRYHPPRITILRLPPLRRHFNSTSPYRDNGTVPLPLHHPVAIASLAETTKFEPVHDRDSLQLRIQYPKNVTSSTPTILRLSHRFNPAPAAPSTAIVIDLWKPSPKSELEEIGEAAEEAGTESEEAGKEAEEAEEEAWEEALDTTYPTVLHDITASLLTVRSLFPDSKTGLLAAGYPAAWALSTALTQGRENVAAVAVDAPIVDLFAEGPVAWDTLLREWVYRKPGPGRDLPPDPRRQIYGEDPTLYWEDTFASPLFFFVTPGVKFPKIPGRDDHHSSDTPSSGLLKMEPEDRRDLHWPPMGFTPGHGWGLNLEDKGMAPRMLLSFGTGEQARAQGLFVNKARRPYKGLQKQVEVGILRKGLSPDVLGMWLECTLRGDDVGAILDPDTGREVPILELETAGGVLLARGLEPLESDHDAVLLHKLDDKLRDELRDAHIKTSARLEDEKEPVSVEELNEDSEAQNSPSTPPARLFNTPTTLKKIANSKNPVISFQAAPPPTGKTETSTPATRARETATPNPASRAFYKLAAKPGSTSK